MSMISTVSKRLAPLHIRLAILSPRRIMSSKLVYPLRQSTDLDACEPVLQPEGASFAFTTEPKASEGDLRQTTRDAVIERVKSKAGNVEVEGRLKGKVGAITGVGPELGIGVSLELCISNAKLMIADRQCQVVCQRG
jgi:hypothetical protein